MLKILPILKKISEKLFNTRAAGLYMLLFAAAIGIATFIENDFGTSAAQKVIFKSRWFELLLVLFGISIITNIFRFRMIQMKKWALLMFHASIVVIIIGAGITRYFGYEGVMHIREREVSNTILSSETSLNFQVLKNGDQFDFSEDVLFASLGNNHWKGSYLIEDDLIEAEVTKFIPNPKQILTHDPKGKPTIKVVFAGMNGREEYFVQQGEKSTIKNVLFNFSSTDLPEAINILSQNDSIFIKSDRVLSQKVMATQQSDTLYPNGGYYPLMLRSMYSDGLNSFVFGDFDKSAVVTLSSESPKVKGESNTAIALSLALNGVKQEQLVFGQKGLQGLPVSFAFGNTLVNVSYGSKEINLPFSIGLYDFIMEKYPGTNSAASYESKVQLIDERNNIHQDERIYMNHILDYEGFRFFQSSFDQDEKGTYLSVNHDFLGTWVSYIGYILLTIGLILSLFSKDSRFVQVTQKIENMRKEGAGVAMMILLCMTASFAFGQNNNQTINQVVSENHAALVSELVVQDYKGRMKPMHTLTRELLRKVSRKESFSGLNADQIVLSMLANPAGWYEQAMIKIGKEESIQKLLNTSSDMVTYNAFFKENGQYLLQEEIRRAYSLQPIDRGAFEKDLMKIDERVNIMSMIFSGRIMKIIPVAGDPNNKWISSQAEDGEISSAQPLADKFFSSYVSALQDGISTNNFNQADLIIEELKAYQKTEGVGVIPSSTRIKGEILLNKLNVFSRLSMFYALLGMAFLVYLFLSVFKSDKNFSKPYKILFWLFLLGFAFHTIGLGLRWYVSGRAPWSNGYESMIYIAWTTTLAGLYFARKSFGGMAATLILSATLLLVAGLSFLDPEITPLVPVLKSYWLTIHVSLEAGSYGFLMLGALIALINLILMIFLTDHNKDKVSRIVKEMSYISEITLIGGLAMVSIGTYLGGVWANESWGRYWGWDAKETWALVTILVYAFILHMRLIPKINGLFAFNIATLFGWASVIMTYYGVNYYLSGLHSYAAGDPVPIPQWVYISVASVITISLLAYYKKRKFPIIS